MRYAMLVYGDQSAWAELDEDEAARLRGRVDAGRWLALFEEMGKADPAVEGRELAAASDAKVVRVVDGERRRHRRPVRGDEGADRRALRDDAARPRRGDPDRRARSGRGVRLARDPARRGALTTSLEADIQRGVASCSRDPHPRPRRPRARRGRGTGRLRKGARALAAGRHSLARPAPGSWRPPATARSTGSGASGRSPARRSCWRGSRPSRPRRRPT